MGGQPWWPRWATRLREQGIVVNHVFDPGFRLTDIQADGSVALVGAGISGGQLALHLAEKGLESVLLVARKAFQISDFHFDPGWLGPTYLDRFHRQSNDQRRQQILAARAKGSVPHIASPPKEIEGTQ
jgi:cation diffusion facilitator CzcD-associated flavoprotein CzcO